MSDLVPIDAMSIPAHLRKSSAKRQEVLDAMNKGVTSGGANYSRISIRAARFRLVTDGEETVLDSGTLQAIIVGINPQYSKSLFTEAWSPDAESNAPACFSLDGLRPHPDAKEPQNDLCATCEKNVFGSSTNAMGKPIKACGDRKRLAVVAADDPTGEIYLLQVTPAALTPLKKYQTELKKLGLGPMDVITHISFDPKASFPKLVFRFGGYVDETTHDKILDIARSDEVQEMIGVKMPGSVEAEAAPVAEEPKKPLLVKAAPPEEVEEVEEVEEAPPPKKKKAAAKEAAPKKEEPVTSSTESDLDDLFDELEVDDG